MKHLVLWSIAARNLGRFGGRTLALAVPLFAVMALAAAMTFLKDGLLQEALAGAESLPDLTVRRLQAGRVASLEASLAGEIRRQPGVRKVTPRIWGAVPLGPADGSVVYTLVGLDADPAADLSLALEEGRFPEPGERGAAVVGRLFAERRGARVGDRLALADELGNQAEFRVVGLFGSRVDLYSADLIVTDLESARAFFGSPPGQVTDLCVEARDPQAAERLATSLGLLAPGLQVRTRQEQADAARVAYGTRSGVFQMMWLVLLLCVLLTAWAQASSISLEMRREIGVLKALGWQTLDIIELKMMETVLVGTTAIAGGILAGLGFVCLGAPGLEALFLGWSTLYPEYPVPVRVEGSSLFLLFATGLLPLCGASVFPAWVLGTLEPDTTIRSG